MRPTKVMALIAVLALAIPLAHAADTKHKLGFGIGYFMPTGDWTQTYDVEGDPMMVAFEADDVVGFGLGYEYRHSELLGFGANLMYAGHDVIGKFSHLDESGEGKSGELAWMPILFDLNFHLFRDKPFDFYLGPTLGYALWDDLALNDHEDVPMSDSFVYGVNFGLDVPFAEGWAFSAGLRYLLVSAETDDPFSVESEFPAEIVEIDVNPVVLTVGIGYKF